MQHSARTSVTGSQRSGTGHRRRYSLLYDSPEDVNSDSQSDIPLYNNDSIQSATPGASGSLHIERHGQDQWNEVFEGVTLTKLSSLGSFTANNTVAHDDLVVPRKASSECLNVKHEDLSASRRRRHTTYLLWNWIWEVLSMITSLGMMAAIIATLKSYDHATHPEWPYNININSLMSLFTTVIIAQLGFILAEIISQLKWLWFNRPHALQDLEHYDAASRGIMGAILFLGRFSRQPRAYLALGAAFILLVSAAIGPFTQQSIESYACERPLNNVSASVAAARWVDSGLTMDVHDPLASPGYPIHMPDSPNMRLLTATLEGLIGSENSSRTVPFDCPTSACDFPPYSSLGYCSSCTDITSLVEERYDPSPMHDELGTYYRKLNYTLPGEDCQLDFSGYGRIYNPPSITTTNAVTKLALCQPLRPVHFNSTILPLIWSQCSQIHGDGSQNGPGCNRHPEQLPGLGNSSDLIALKCSVGLCVRDYIGRVRNGVLEETATNKFPSNYMIHAGDEETTMLNLPCIVDSKVYDLSNLSQVPSIPGRKFTTVILDGQRVTTPLECVFKVGSTVAFGIREVLQRVLGSGGCMLQRGHSSECDPWYMEAMFRGGSLTAETMSADMDRIAVAISNQMRAVGSNAYGNGSGAALGTVIQTTVCVRVEWAWLLLPAALVLLTAVLFVALLCMARPSGDPQPVWKSSALVAFFHGVDARDQTDGGASRVVVASAKDTRNPAASREESHGGLMSLESMHARAKKTMVKLSSAAAGRRGFVMVNADEEDQLESAHKLDSQRQPTDSHDGGQRQSPSGRGQAPRYLQADPGTDLTPSTRSSLDSSTRPDLEGNPGRDV